MILSTASATLVPGGAWLLVAVAAGLYLLTTLPLALLHRLSTAARADRVLVLEGGRLVEDGHHDELVHAGGTYQRLFDAWLSATST